MGTIKFYNGGQSVTEAMLFGLSDLTTHNLQYSLSVYPINTYSDKELATLTVNRIIPRPSYLSSGNTSVMHAWLRRFGYPNNVSSSGGPYGMIFASSDNTHDKTLSTFHNAVASANFLSEATYNGVKTIILSLTNLDSENSATIRSFQRSNCFFFGTINSIDTNWTYYLDWAYYLDEDEYITLEPGETKSVVLNFTLSDLTA